jgi:hypothetical protein
VWARRDPLVCPHRADIDDGTALPLGDHPGNDGLGDEKRRAVQFVE